MGITIFGLKARSVLEDKGYDSNIIVSYIESQNMIATIPSCSNRTKERSYDKKQYKQRNVVERFFNKIKEELLLDLIKLFFFINHLSILLVFSTFFLSTLPKASPPERQYK